MKDRKKLIALLLAAVMVLALAACGKQENVPDITSENAGLYIAATGSAVVDRDNTVAANYSVDKKGNIVNVNGNTIVSADKTATYVPVAGLSVSNANAIAFPINLLTNAFGDAMSSTVELQVTVSPATATCREIRVESNNPDVAQPQNTAFSMSVGSDTVSIPVTLKSAGVATLTFSSPSDKEGQYAVSMDVSAALNDATGLPLATDPNATGDPNAAGGTTADPNGGGAAVPPGTGTTAYVTATAANFREEASTDSQVIDVLTRGTEVTRYSTSNGWANVTFNGKTGYISGNLLSDTKPTGTAPAATQAPAPVEVDEDNSWTGYVTASNLNLREGPSTGDDVVTSVGWGTRITVYSVSNGWAYVYADGEYGYVAANYVSDTAPSGNGGGTTTYEENWDDPYA